MNYRRRLLQNSVDAPQHGRCDHEKDWGELLACEMEGPLGFCFILFIVMLFLCFCCEKCKRLGRKTCFAYWFCQNTKPDRTDEERSATVERVLVHLRKMNPPAPSEPPVTGTLEDG